MKNKNCPCQPYLWSKQEETNKGGQNKKKQTKNFQRYFLLSLVLFGLVVSEEITFFESDNQI